MRESTAAQLTAVQAVGAMRRGEIRAEDYARALLARAEKLAQLNAFRCLDAERVLEEARAADKLRSNGATPGRLHGLPVPVKDSVNTRALPTTHGTRALRDFRPREDAVVVRRLRDNGAFVMGKTSLHELSRGWTSNNEAFGAVRNAYDPQRIPGGSSGGSATAVAGRIAPLAVAEDTWGSIRVPAAFCGVVGFRPTVGHYPNAGVMSLTLDRFDQVGPMARTVADIALFDEAIAGTAPIQCASLAGVRLGVPQQFLADLDPEVEGIFAAALARLRDAGAVLVHAPLPLEATLCADISGTIIGYENLATIPAYLEDQETGLTFEELIAQASPNLQKRYAAPVPSRVEYEGALRGRVRAIEAIGAHFRAQRMEALVFPPVMAPAPPLGDNPEIEVGNDLLAIRTVVGRNTALGNCASLASLVMPAGLTKAGLPVAVEFDMPPGKDRELLALGLALEQALGPIPPPAPIC